MVTNLFVYVSISILIKVSFIVSFNLFYLQFKDEYPIGNRRYRHEIPTAVADHRFDHEVVFVCNSGDAIYARGYPWSRSSRLDLHEKENPGDVPPEESSYGNR
jgi:hypothetical protein